MARKQNAPREETPEQKQARQELEFLTQRKEARKLEQKALSKTRRSKVKLDIIDRLPFGVVLHITRRDPSTGQEVTIPSSERALPIRDWMRRNKFKPWDRFGDDANVWVGKRWITIRFLDEQDALEFQLAFPHMIERVLNNNREIRHLNRVIAARGVSTRKKKDLEEMELEC